MVAQSKLIRSSANSPKSGSFCRALPLLFDSGGMSAFGPKRTCVLLCRMCAFGVRADNDHSSSPIPIYRYHGLLGGFVLRLLTNFILGALYFTKARGDHSDRRLPCYQPSLAACGKLLTRVLLPAIKRLLLFFSRKVIVFHNIIGRGVKGRRMFNFVHLEF